MPERVLCRNGTNSSEIVRENVGAQFRSLRNTFQFAGVRWTMPHPKWKMLGGTAEKVHPPGGAHDGRWLDVIAHG